MKINKMILFAIIALYSCFSVAMKYKQNKNLCITFSGPLIKVIDGELGGKVLLCNQLFRDIQDVSIDKIAETGVFTVRFINGDKAFLYLDRPDVYVVIQDSNYIHININGHFVCTRSFEQIITDVSLLHSSFVCVTCSDQSFITFDYYENTADCIISPDKKEITILFKDVQAGKKRFEENIECSFVIADNAICVVEFESGVRRFFQTQAFEDISDLNTISCDEIILSKDKNRTCLANRSRRNATTIFDLKGSTVTEIKKIAFPYEYGFFSPSGRYICLQQDREMLRIYDLNNGGKRIRRLPSLSEYPIGGPQFAANETFFAGVYVYRLSTPNNSPHSDEFWEHHGTPTVFLPEIKIVSFDGDNECKVVVAIGAQHVKDFFIHPFLNYCIVVKRDMVDIYCIEGGNYTKKSSGLINNISYCNFNEEGSRFNIYLENGSKICYTFSTNRFQMVKHVNQERESRRISVLMIRPNRASMIEEEEEEVQEQGQDDNSWQEEECTRDECHRITGRKRSRLTENNDNDDDFVNKKRKIRRK